MRTFFFLILSLVLFSCASEAPKEEDLKIELKEKRDEYLKKGKLITETSFMALSSTLKRSIEENGIEGALATCNVQALPLTDSLASVFNASIKRTAIRTRNPKNKPTEEEKHMLKLYQRASEAGEELKPFLLVPDDKNCIVFFTNNDKAVVLKLPWSVGKDT